MKKYITPGVMFLCFSQAYSQTSTKSPSASASANIFATIVSSNEIEVGKGDSTTTESELSSMQTKNFSVFNLLSSYQFEVIVNNDAQFELEEFKGRTLINVFSENDFELIINYD